MLRRAVFIDACGTLVSLARVVTTVGGSPKNGSATISGSLWLARGTCSRSRSRPVVR